jgi:hypothetical protein
MCSAIYKTYLLNVSNDLDLNTSNMLKRGISITNIKFRKK